MPVKRFLVIVGLLLFCIHVRGDNQTRVRTDTGVRSFARKGERMPIWHGIHLQLKHGLGVYGYLETGEKESEAEPLARLSSDPNVFLVPNASAVWFVTSKSIKKSPPKDMKDTLLTMTICKNGLVRTTDMETGQTFWLAPF